jgi:tetratricopeptide (TPR) repeat protein
LRKPAVALAAALLLLFAAVTLLKLRSRGNGAGGAPADQPTAATGRTREFWEIYRQATDERIAGHTQAAVQAYAKALELNPRHEDALYYLGNMDLALGRYAQAGAAWERLVTVNPASARAHSRLGDLHFCLQPGAPLDVARAEAEFRRAHEINGDETGPLLRLGEIALVRGSPARARYYLQAVIGTDAGSVAAHFLEGYLAWHAGDMQLAAAMFTRAVELARPRGPATRSNEGDTKHGTAPLTAPSVGCDAFQVSIDGLAAPAAGPATRMPDAYRGLDSLIERYRRFRPRR